jgi:hypothetical protein
VVARCTTKVTFISRRATAGRPYEQDKKMCSICSQSKGIYRCRHNKKETRGGLSVRVFLHRIVFNLKTVMSLPFQAAQTFVGAGTKKLYQTL